MKTSNGIPPKSGIDQFIHDLITTLTHPIVTITGLVLIVLLVIFVFSRKSGSIPPDAAAATVSAATPTTPAQAVAVAPAPAREFATSDSSLPYALAGLALGILSVLGYQQIKKQVFTHLIKQEPIRKGQITVSYKKDVYLNHAFDKPLNYYPRRGQRVDHISILQEHPIIHHTCLSADRVPLLVHLSAVLSIIDADKFLSKSKNANNIAVSEIKTIITREIGCRDRQAVSADQRIIWRRLVSELPDKIKPYGLKLDSIQIENISIDRGQMTEAARIAEDIQMLDATVRLADRRTINILTRKQTPPE